MAGAPLAAIQLTPSSRTGWPFTTLALGSSWTEPSKDLESLDAAFTVGTLLLLLIGIGIARVPFLVAPAGWAALPAECAGPALGYGEHRSQPTTPRITADPGGGRPGGHPRVPPKRRPVSWS